MTYVFWLGIGFLIISVAIEVFRWKRTVRLFGRIPLWTLSRMLQYARAGRIALLINLATLALVSSLLLLLSPFRIELGVPASFALFGLAGVIHIFSRCSQPPTILLLTSSSARTPHLLQRVNAAIFPLRAVALIDERRYGLLSPVLWSMDNLRTHDDNIWKGIVNSLIDIAPVVIIDTQGDTAAVAQETSLMLDSDRIRKAVFLTDGSGRYPALSANGIDPYEHALRLVDVGELMEQIAHYALGRGYLPWPAVLPSSPPGDIAPEHWHTLPSMLVVAHPDDFDSVRLIWIARTSGKQLVQVVTQWTQLTPTGAQYVLNLTWEFLHDRRLAAISVLSMELLIVRISFLEQFGGELQPVYATRLKGPLTFEQLMQPDPIHTAVRTWAAEVERVAKANRWRTRAVIPPVGEEPESLP